MMSYSSKYITLDLSQKAKKWYIPQSMLIKDTKLLYGIIK